MKKYITLLLFTIPAFLLAQVKESKEELIAQVKANPSRVETLKTIQRVGGYNPDYKELRDLFKGLDKSVRRSPEGEPFSLSDLRGKYVLIEFWASWCPDCRKANPNLVKTYNTFKDKNFEILGVSFDRKYEDWVAAIEKDKLAYSTVITGSSNYKS